MRRLQFILVFLTALVTLASGLGRDPLSYIIPSVAPFTLPALLVAALIGVLLYRARDLETPAFEHRADHPGALVRYGLPTGASY